MRLARSFKLLLLATLLAAGLSAAAQEVGTFTLAHATRWGNVEVPAGQYSISLSNPARVATLRPTNPSGTAVFVLPRAWDYRATCKAGTLNLVAGPGGYRAESLCLPEVGLVLYFSSPQSVPAVLAKAAAGSAPAGSR